ncbi:MAG: SDR family NAD(P)-dependent oxidoreductase [Bacteroidales bacterium]
MNQIALITGATAGIGYATALKLAENGFNLIITGRREERLKKLKSEIENKHNIKIYSLCFDIRNKDEVFNTIDGLPDEWKNIDILVNNAGLAAGLETIQEGDIEDWERMIDTNVKGLLYITRKVAPYMVDKEKGHIINVGSIAGKEVYKNGNVYCATKHAVDALTKGMRIDMLHKNIKVTQIAPGMVETEFSLVRFKGDKEKAEKAYQGFTPLTGDDVAEIILFAVTRPPHVNLNDIVITATEQANSFYKNIK